MSGFQTLKNPRVKCKPPLAYHTRKDSSHRLFRGQYRLRTLYRGGCDKTRETSFENDRPKKTQVLTLLRGRLALLEAIGQEETNQSCSVNASLLLVRRASQVVVELGPKTISKLLVIRVVTPKVPSCC